MFKKDPRVACHVPPLTRHMISNARPTTSGTSLFLSFADVWDPDSRREEIVGGRLPCTMPPSKRHRRAPAGAPAAPTSTTAFAISTQAEAVALETGYEEDPLAHSMATSATHMGRLPNELWEHVIPRIQKALTVLRSATCTPRP